MSSQTPWNSAYNNAKGSLLVGNATRPIVRPVGTDGQLLTADSAQADGVDWKTVTGIVNEASITLTSLQVKALTGTPILMIPAQGANKIIVVYSCVARMAYGGTNPFIAPSNIDLVFFAPGITTAWGVAVSLGALQAVNSSSSMADQNTTFTAKQDFEVYNVPIYVKNQGAAITGNAANNNTVTIKCLYYVFTMP